jgi:two-component system cell cycle sensor histidine kinase/response regulator CckA
MMNQDTSAHTAETSVAPRVGFLLRPDVMVGLFVTVLAVVGGTGLWITNTFFESQRSMVRAAQMMREHLPEAHLWLEESFQGDASVDPGEAVFGRIRSVAAIVQTLDRGGVAEGVVLPALADGDGRAALTELNTELRTWTDLATARLADRAHAGPGSELDRKFDATYNRLLAQASRVNRAVERRGDRFDRGMVVAIVVLATLMFGASAALVALVRQSRLRQNAEQERLEAVVRNRMAEIQTAKHRLDLALEASETCTWDSDFATGRVDLDPQWSVIRGGPPQPTVTTQRRLLELIHPEDRRAMLKAARDAHLTAEGRYGVDQRMRTLDGRWIWIRSAGRVMARDASGRPTRVIGTNRDITSWKIAEIELARQAAFLAMLQQTTLDLLSRRGLSEVFATLVARASGLMEAPFCELLLKEGEEFVVQAGTGSLQTGVGLRLPRSEGPLYWQAHDSGRTVVVDDYNTQPHRHPHYREADVRASARFPILLDGACVGILALSRDSKGERFTRHDLEQGVLLAQTAALVIHNAAVHEQTQREATTRTAALRENEERFRGVFDQSPIAIALLSYPEGRIVELNDAACKLGGILRADAVGHTSSALGVWDDPAQRLSYLDQLKAHGSASGYEARFRRIDGTLCEVLYTGRILEIGGKTYTLNSIQDVTDRHRAETALRASEERFRVLAEVSPAGIFHSDAKGFARFVNARWCEIAGVGGEFALGDDWLAAVHPEDRERVRTGWAEAVRTGASSSGEFRFLHRDGTVVHVVGQSRPQIEADGAVVGWVGVVTDVTQLRVAEEERKKIEGQLRQVQKMDSLGTLAGGIAHDFNNILTGIFGFVELARHDLAPGHPAHTWLEQTVSAAKRAKDLVGQILTFSRRNEGERRPLLAHAVVAEAVGLLRSTIPAEVELTARLEAGCAPIMGDPTQIHQVVMNLCTNAWQALPARGGRIAVALEPAVIGHELQAEHPGATEGPAIKLSVTDNGVGMDARTLSRIFEPFFTTKETGKGTGLGLAVVHGVVSSHAGAITVRSAPGQGTTFDLYFPVLRNEALSLGQLAGEAVAPPRGRGERLLFVDDDPVSHYAIHRVLLSLGYTVVGFQRPEEALAAFRAEAAGFALVLSDLSMPGIGGAELAREILRIAPTVPVVVMTGLADATRRGQLIASGVREVLLKPQSRTEIALALQRHLPRR